MPWMGRDGDKYRGEYSYDEKTDTVSGNPGHSAVVQDLLKAIKRSASGDSTTRNHAEAMTIGDMRKWMQWSEAEVPIEMANRPDLVHDAKQLEVVSKHVMMRAFAASGFTLWTR